MRKRITLPHKIYSSEIAIRKNMLCTTMQNNTDKHADIWNKIEYECKELQDQKR